MAIISGWFALVTPAVLAAGSFLNPITGFAIRKSSRRTGGKDRRRYRGDC
jgi:hypothetical protein